MTKKYTTPREVMEALLAGKKLTHPKWPVTNYIHLVNGFVVDRGGTHYFEFALTGSFIEYNPPKKYLQDISELATVKKVRIEYPEWYYGTTDCLSRCDGQWFLPELEKIAVAILAKWPVEILEEV